MDKPDQKPLKKKVNLFCEFKLDVKRKRRFLDSIQDPIYHTKSFFVHLNKIA